MQLSYDLTSITARRHTVICH